MAEKKVFYAPPDFPESKLSDEVTRTRRNLIAAMAVWTLIVPLSLHPKKIVLFDIDLDTAGISVTTLISFALVYFWASFMIYAYKDWLTWWHKCRSLIDEKKMRVNLQGTQIRAVVEAVREAQGKGKKDDDRIDVKYPIEGGISDSTNKLSGWESHIPNWKREFRQRRKELRQIRTDIYLRSLWDYWLPTAIILGPLWYFLR